MAKATWTHKELHAWQKALELAEYTYLITRAFPQDERFGLSAQMRRAAVSVVSNIAEGAARNTRRDFLNFLHIARGSLAELDTQAALAIRLALAPEIASLPLHIERVAQILTGLIAKVRRDGQR